jgi:hypothetical protein
MFIHVEKVKFFMCLLKHHALKKYPIAPQYENTGETDVQLA